MISKEGKYIAISFYVQLQTAKHGLKPISTAASLFPVQFDFLSVKTGIYRSSGISGLVIFFGLVLSLKLQIRVNWDFLVPKGFIFEVSSQSLKRREAEKMEL